VSFYTTDSPPLPTGPPKPPEAICSERQRFSVADRSALVSCERKDAHSWHMGNLVVDGLLLAYVSWSDVVASLDAEPGSGPEPGPGPDERSPAR
jgi:hypothetical protein